jgi:hypothetical protein
MSYVGLPPRWLDAELDATGNNTGNWTNAFTADVLAARVPWCEIYHAVAENVPVGAAATIKIGMRTYSFTSPDGGSEWDPAQPALVQDGQDVYFYWSAAASGTPPRVTLWLRYDPALLRGGYEQP